MEGGSEMNFMNNMQATNKHNKIFGKLPQPIISN